MTVGELLDQIQKLVAAGACTVDTPVLADGCDCWGEAKAAVVVQRGVDSKSPCLLVSREDYLELPVGVRVSDLPSARTFTTTEAKGS